MKKNVPSDGLEEFLKNTFEEYSESPPEEVWGRIAAAKGAMPKPYFKILHSYSLWIGVAAAIFTGFIIYQSVYINQELHHINRAVEQQHAEIQELKQPKSPSSNVEKLLPSSLIPQDTFNQINESNKLNEKRVTASTTAAQLMAEKSTTKHVAVTARTTQSNAPHSTKSKSNPNIVNDLVAQQTLTHSPKSLDKTIYTQSIPTVGETSSEALQPAVANVNSTKVFELNKLANLQKVLPVINRNTIITIPAALPLPIEPVREKNGFYVGIQAISTQNKSRITTHYPFPLPPRDRKEFTQATVKANNSFALGLQLGKKIANNWSLESGALYRNTSITSTHQPIFKFKDRKFPPHGGGGGPRDSQFDYDLNTPNGTVAVSVTVESRANTTPRDEEEVALNITSEQSLSYLSVPLLLNYQIGNGKLHLNAKGGALLNFLLENDFNITDVTSNNNNFRPQTNQRFQNKPMYFNPLSLDYLLQIGVSYDLTKHLSLQLDPTFIGSITNQSSNRFIQTTNTSVGLSAGVTWGF